MAIVVRTQLRYSAVQKAAVRLQEKYMRAKILSAFPLSGFLHQTAKKYKPLTSEEQTELGKRILIGDIEARNLMVLHNQHLVHKVARRWLYVARVGGRASIEYKDLVQNGVIGLIRAAEKWNYKKASFNKYAWPWIRCMLTEAVMESGVIQVPPNMQVFCYHVLQTMKDYLSANGTEPRPEKIADKLHCSVRKVKYALDIMYINTKMASLEDKVQSHHPWTRKKEEAYALKDYIVCDRFLRPDLALEAKQALTEVRNRFNMLSKALASSNLSEKNQQIFKERYGLHDGTLTKYRIPPIAKAYGVSRERIRQIVVLVWQKVKGTDIPTSQKELLAEFDRYRELESIVAAT